MLIGERIRELRKQKNMTQHDLASTLGVSKTIISEYENNFKSPNNNNLEKLADILDVSIDYLFGRDITVVNEDGAFTNVSKQDLEIINNIKCNKKLYHELYLNPKRTIKQMEKIVKDSK